MQFAKVSISSRALVVSFAGLSLALASCKCKKENHPAPKPLDTRPGNDFNGDGKDDLAVGVPGESLGEELGPGFVMMAVGAVNVLHGSASGFGAKRSGAAPADQFWHQGKWNYEGLYGDPVGGVPALELTERFGHALAGGDFNGDGYADLAVGVPGEGEIDGGAINVLYGSAEGLKPTIKPYQSKHINYLHQGGDKNPFNLQDAYEADDRFGSALAAGDFDADGFCDLAVGVPGEDISGKLNAGAVNVVYGSPDGLKAGGDQFWHQGHWAVLDDPETTDSFGAALATGDFDGDGYSDLAIGVPGERVLPEEPAVVQEGNTIKVTYDGPPEGAVAILYGSPCRLQAGGIGREDQLLRQGDPGVLDSPEGGDEFGRALAAGDFDGDGKSDLAIGVFGEDLVESSSLADAGAVNVVYGSADGLGSRGQFWTQGSPGVLDSPEQHDRFGRALATGDFDGDGNDDLAIGVPGEDSGAGAASVLVGSATGLTAANDQILRQGAGGLPDQPEWVDSFGWAVAAGDYDGDGADDLVVGAPKEGPPTFSGVAMVVYGRSGVGLAAERSAILSQDSPGVPDQAESNNGYGGAHGEEFGWALE